MKVKAYKWDGHTIHPYTIQTSRAKHPVRMIEGGAYLTEDMETEFDPQSDMGIFGLNAKDYQTFKANLVEVEIEIPNR